MPSVTDRGANLSPFPLPPQDFAERHGYIKGVVTDIIHDPGRGAPLAKVRAHSGSNTHSFVESTKSEP
jgi:ribosomal protein L2